VRRPAGDTTVVATDVLSLAPPRAPVTEAPPRWPFSVRVHRIAAFCNGELPEHPVYDGFELQWFDDATHGRGMLAFLSRRADRRVDYYVDPGLRIDRSGYLLGAGTGRWVPTTFAAARLAVSFDGLEVDVRFVDVDGRTIEVHADDRGAGSGRRGMLLAPFGDGIDHPTALTLVAVHGFDLVRRVGAPPTVRIDGEPTPLGRLPGARLHRRHLLKYGGPLTVAAICPAGGAVSAEHTEVTLTPDGRRLRAVADRRDGGAVELRFRPPVPSLEELPEGTSRTGAWRVDVDDVPTTGGTWTVRRASEGTTELTLEVARPWRPPPGEPPLLRTVTRLLPVFRRWPTTYRWRASLGAADGARTGWERTSPSRAATYRRLTSPTPRR
jgi:hypothetical protein